MRKTIERTMGVRLYTMDARNCWLLRTFDVAMFDL